MLLSITYRGFMDLVNKYAPVDRKARFTSHDLRKIFRGQVGGKKIDPRKDCPQFYSSQRPDCAITYPWEMDLRKEFPIFWHKYRARIAKDCSDSHERFEKSFEDITFWIDIAFIDQNTNEIAKALEDAQDTYSRALHHVVFVAWGTLSRGWCLFEIAARLREIIHEFSLDCSKVLELIQSIGLDSLAGTSYTSIRDWKEYSASYVAEKKLSYLIFVPGITEEMKDLQTFCDTDAIDSMVTGVVEDKTMIKIKLSLIMGAEDTFNKLIKAFAENSVRRFKEECAAVAKLEQQVKEAEEARKGGEESKTAAETAGTSEVTQAQHELRAAEEKREQVVKALDEEVANAKAQLTRAEARSREAMQAAQVKLDTLVAAEAATRAELQRALELLHRFEQPEVTPAPPAPVVNLPTGTLLGADVLKSPRCAALDQEGRIRVSDFELHQIFVLNRDGSVVQRLGSEGTAVGQFKNPIGIAVDGQGRIVVTDLNNHRIQVLNADGSVALCFGSYGTAVGQLKHPACVAWDREGCIVVAEFGNHRIQVFNADGCSVRHFGSEGAAVGELNGPCGVAMDGAGRIVVAEENNDRVQVFNQDGSVALCFGSKGSGPGQFHCPKGVAVDREGSFVIADCYNHRVQVFDSDGRFMRVIGAEGPGVGQLKYPYGVTVDGAGRILVAEVGGAGNHRVQVF